MPPLLNLKDTKYIQSVIGIFLYYGWALDNTILPALNEIASEQSKLTKSTMNKAQWLIDYATTYPDAYIRFYASNMILNIDSDAVYFVAPKSRSKVAGYFHLASIPNIK